MLKAGMATVYEAKTGAEFGELEAEYRAAEEKAKKAKRGIWSREGLESPREYKNRTRDEGDLRKSEDGSGGSWLSKMLPWSKK